MKLFRYLFPLKVSCQCKIVLDDIARVDATKWKAYEGYSYSSVTHSDLNYDLGAFMNGSYVWVLSRTGEKGYFGIRESHILEKEMRRLIDNINQLKDKNETKRWHEENDKKMKQIFPEC